MQKHLTKNHKMLGLLGATVAFILVAVYLKVTPEEASIVNGLPKLILVYGHSLCWALLALASILWSISIKNKWSIILAYLALGTYIIFIVTMLTAKFTH